MAADDPSINVIDLYTRKPPLKEGNLIDVTDQDKETGIEVQVAAFLKRYERNITPPIEPESEGLSATGRLNALFDGPLVFPSKRRTSSVSRGNVRSSRNSYSLPDSF